MEWDIFRKDAKLSFPNKSRHWDHANDADGDFRPRHQKYEDIKSKLLKYLSEVR